MQREINLAKKLEETSMKVQEAIFYTLLASFLVKEGADKCFIKRAGGNY